MLPILAAGLLLVAGCRPRVKSPGFNLRGMTADSTGGLVVRLAVSNPNRFEFKARDLTYRILIDSNVCGSGNIPGPLQVGGGDTVEVEFPLQVNLGNILKSLPGIFGDTIRVRVEGSCTVMTLLGNRRVKLDREKHIVLKDELKAVLGRLFQ
jgi:LEA14-like dessication related protein